VAAIGLAAWLFVGAVVEWADRVKLFRAAPGESWRRARNLPRSAHGMTLAHAGLAVAMAGMVGASVWKSEVVTNLRPGETVEIAGYSLLFEGVGKLDGPNYKADRARFTVTRDGEEITVLFPEKRIYQVKAMPTTEAAIHTTWLRDLYIVLGTAPTGPTGPDTPATNEGYIVRIYKNPLVVWIWAGFAITGLAGLFSLTDRRHRVGAPQPARAIPAATPVAAEVGAD
jgi:cytochrome c-type biogenesis protein CcmF